MFDSFVQFQLGCLLLPAEWCLHYLALTRERWHWHWLLRVDEEVWDMESWLVGELELPPRLVRPRASTPNPQLTFFCPELHPVMYSHAWCESWES